MTSSASDERVGLLFCRQSHTLLRTLKPPASKPLLPWAEQVPLTCGMSLVISDLRVWACSTFVAVLGPCGRWTSTSSLGRLWALLAVQVSSSSMTTLLASEVSHVENSTCHEHFMKKSSACESILHSSDFLYCSCLFMAARGVNSNCF